MTEREMREVLIAGVRIVFWPGTNIIRGVWFLHPLARADWVPFEKELDK